MGRNAAMEGRHRAVQRLRALLLGFVVAVAFGVPFGITQAHADNIIWDQTLCTNGITGGGWCHIINGAHDLCLSANPNYDGSNGDAVYLYACPYRGMSTAQTLAETWTTTYQEPGYPDGSVVNYAHHLCLDANAGGDGSNGDTVQLWSCWNGANQGWFPDDPINSLLFRNAAHFLCLDANGGADGSNGDRVQLWSCWGGSNQHWGDNY